MVVARKRFGQNFLVDPRKADRLVAALDIRKGDAVLEIGPGTGMLTERILARDAFLTAVEIDRELIPALRERFAGYGLFKLVEEDIINIDPAVFSPGRIKVIGNLPYNISGAVVDWLIDHFKTIDVAVITMQKEVADRLRADPGGRDYGALSVLAQSFYDIARLFDIPPGCFSPRPKVDSSVLRLSPGRKLDKDINYGAFRDFVRGCFHHKRKKITNSLAASLGFDKALTEQRLTALGKSPNCRAEELGLYEFYEFFRLSR